MPNRAKSDLTPAEIKDARENPKPGDVWTFAGSPYTVTNVDWDFVDYVYGQTNIDGFSSRERWIANCNACNATLVRRDDS